MTNGKFLAGESPDRETALRAREIRVKFKINFLQRPATSCKEAILRTRKVLRQELGSVQDNTEHCTQLEHLLWPENSAQTTQKQIQIRGGLIMKKTEQRTV